MEYEEEREENEIDGQRGARHGIRKEICVFILCCICKIVCLSISVVCLNILNITKNTYWKSIVFKLFGRVYRGGGRDEE